ncbi:MAG: prepilin-type N-terminal cleavage/methylation domain-containing protein [Planctomycetota bacterium]
MKKNLRSQQGFTLIELIVVMAILTILSGLIIPKLDVFKLKANKAQSAANMSGVDRFVASYKVQRDLFPDGNDSLLEDGTNTFYAQLDPQLTGSTTGSPTKLTTTTIANDSELRSLQRVGLTTVNDHDPAAGFPGDSAAGTTPRTLAVNDTIATINAADSDGQAILRHLYPQTDGVVPANEKVVVFGLGPRNAMIPDTLHVAPFYANTAQTSYYNRFLLCYALDTGGGRARFLAALGSDADTISEEINEFYEIN